MEKPTSRQCRMIRCKGKYQYFRTQHQPSCRYIKLRSDAFRGLLVPISFPTYNRQRNDFMMYSNRTIHYSVSCAHMPKAEQSESSTISKRSVRSVVLLPARRALGRIYQALVTGLIMSGPLPLSEESKQKQPETAATINTQSQLVYAPPPPKDIHPAFRQRDSDEWSDDDPKTRHRLARFFPQQDTAMEGHRSLPSDVALKLAEADKRFSMESQRSSDGRPSFDTAAETLDAAAVFQQKRRDSGLTINTIEEDVQVAKAVPLRRAVRKSFYPPPRPGSK